MKKWLKIGVPVAAVVLFVLPGAVGWLTYSQLVREAPRIPALYADLGREASHEIERGWFSTRYRFEVLITNANVAQLIRDFIDGEPSLTPPLVEIDLSIRHGLLPLAPLSQGGLIPAFGNVLGDAHVQVDGQRLRVPVTAIGRLNLLGRTRLRLRVEPGELALPAIPDVHWQYEGGTFDVRELGAAGAARGVGKFGDIVTRNAGAGTFTIAGLEVLLHTQFDGQSVDWHEIGLAFGSVDFASSTREVASLDLQDLDFRVAKEQVSGRMRVDSRLGIESAAYDAERSDGIRLALDGDFDAPLLRALFTLLAEPGIEPQRLQSESARMLLELAREGLDVNLTELYFGTPQGALKTTFDVALPAGDADPTNMLRRASGNAHFEAPIALVRYVAGLTPDGETSLRTALAAGFVIVNGDRYVSDLVYDRGSLEVNGFPMPLPF